MTSRARARGPRPRPHPPRPGGRKDAGFNVADRIRIEVKTGPAANDAIAAHLDAVKHETLAVAFGRTEATPEGFVAEGKLGDEPIAIGVSRAA